MDCDLLRGIREVSGHTAYRWPFPDKAMVNASSPNVIGAYLRRRPTSSCHSPIPSTKVKASPPRPFIPASRATKPTMLPWYVSLFVINPAVSQKMKMWLPLISPPLPPSRDRCGTTERSSSEWLRNDPVSMPVSLATWYLPVRLELIPGTRTLDSGLIGFAAGCAVYWSVGFFLVAPWSWIEETLGILISCGNTCGLLH